MVLLEVNNLKTYFHTRHGIVRAVDGISFSVDEGETLGIVGESGCGKSVTGYSIMGLIPQPPGRIESGSAVYDGEDLLKLDGAAMRAYRGSRVSMIFQDPMTSLNPYLKISTQLMEPLLVHQRVNKKDALNRAVEMLEQVGISDADKRIHRYPHEFSGGMRQRVMIAMALITRPRLLIADEPTTALDVTVQSQILTLVKKMQEELGTAIIFISHDLGVMARVSDRVAVMYAGRIMEEASSDRLYRNPSHPYTDALLRSIPSTHQKYEPLFSIPGQPPDLTAVPKGCPFVPRCGHAEDVCSHAMELKPVEDDHESACVRVQDGEVLSS